MNDILRKTEADVLQWSVTRPQSHTGFLPVIDGVRRIVCANYQLGERNYGLFFIESRIKGVGDFGAVVESSSFEIYILNEKDEVALILGDGLVERDDLLRLAGLIGVHNDQTKEFFEAFDRSGAA